jgi:Domain of unknown function (DUF5615)
MKLLFDECVPRKVKFLFADGGHECETVRDAGFSGKENGELLALAEGHFDNRQEHSVSAEHDGPEHRYLDHPRSFERSG